MRSPSWCLAFGLLFTGLTASAAPPPVSTPTPASAPARATVILASRSIGSKRGEPPMREAHAALLVRFEGKAGGFIVQGGPSPVTGTTRMACTAWVIPSADPDRDFTRAVGAYWGEDTVARELPTRTLATFTVSGLDEAHLRAMVKELIAELRPHDYRFDRGPNSNSFMSLLLDKLHLLAPAANAEDLPGWGWKP
ncbi:MAG TPA: hypothetical protein VFA20_14410 [Myxococcaceae bacterium]|nr:hypothetical protein [Myxococcaceae bacterium]